jgi:hypothetical protein
MIIIELWYYRNERYGPKYIIFKAWYVAANSKPLTPLYCFLDYIAGQKPDLSLVRPICANYLWLNKHF